MEDLPGSRTVEVPTGEDEYTISAPDGTEIHLPAFQTSDGAFRVRFRTPLDGVYRIHGPGSAAIEVQVDGAQPPAPVLVADGRRLATEDGEPFLWLADTWWYALSGRLESAELAALATRRRAEGFSVVQLVAGLLPEVYSFDDLGALEGLWPWTPGYEEIEPRWWDAADARVRTIVEAGLVPAIVGAWSYYLLDVGQERIERHWREIVARWSALPVVWCIAGEAGLPHYEQVGSPEEAGLVSRLTQGWGEVTRGVRRLDPYANLVTIHPCPAFEHLSSVDVLGGATDLDLVWLQTGHADREAVPQTLAAVEREVAAEHGLPVINSEVCYEGIAAGSAATLQRFLFWSHILSGAAGHSYGAQGVWAFRRAQDPGPGLPWGDATWQEAVELPGGRQLGAAAGMLREFEWERLRPSPESLSVHADSDRRVFPYAARDERRVVAYFPAASLLPVGTGISQDLAEASLERLEPGEWSLTWWNPRAGAEFERRVIAVGADGRGALGSSRGFTAMPSMEDWVLVAERRS